MTEFKDFWEALKKWENTMAIHYRKEAERILNERLDLGEWKIIFEAEHD